jgi:hypothetical protein
MRDVIRRIRLAPYRKGMGPRFALTVWDTGRVIGGKCQLGYRLNQVNGNRRSTLFEGGDFCCSPLHAIDSDESIGALLGFLTLRPGDTDSEYFTDYTPQQLEFCEQHAESLAWEVEVRFGEGGSS